MRSFRFLFAGTVGAIFGLFACGDDDSTSPPSDNAEAMSPLCRKIADYAAECGASAGTCDKALVADCSNVTGLLSDSFVDAVSACLVGDALASPMSCFTKAVSTLELGDSQTELVKSVCKTCTDIPFAPPSLASSCESAFIEGVDVKTVGHVNAGALFAVVGDSVADGLRTECVKSVTDCVPAAFSTCAQKVLIEKGFPQNTVECFVGSILGGQSPDVSSGSCVPATGSGGESSASMGDGGSTSSMMGTGGSGGSTMGTGGSGGSTAGTGGSGGSMGTGGGSTTKACFNAVVTVDDLTLLEGDADFGGNGPLVGIMVTLTQTASTVTAHTCVTMTETASDWTTGHRCVPTTVNVPNDGFVTAPQHDIAYTDTDHTEDDAVAEASSGVYDPAFILSAVCHGDRFGDDVCSGPDCAYCELVLGCVNVHAP